MIPEGLLNYLALLGWSLSKDQDVFSPEQLVAAFDVHDVNPNPARFDPKKCEAINAEHVRLLEAEDFRNRLVPYLADVYPDPADPTGRPTRWSAQRASASSARASRRCSPRRPRSSRPASSCWGRPETCSASSS